MTIERLLKEDRTGPTIQYRVEVYQEIIIVGEDFLSKADL